MIGYRIGPRGEYLGAVELETMANGEPVCPPGIVTATLPEQMMLDESHSLVYRNEQWQIMEDHVGQEYWLAGDEHDTEPHVMLDYGALPDGALTERPAAPTELEKWLDSIKDKTAEELRSHFYSTQRYKFIDDDISKGPSDVAMCILDGKAMTVDEASQQWLRYYGDDDDKANAALLAKVAAKDYIRTAVAGYLDEEESV